MLYNIHMFAWLLHNSPLLYLTQSLWRDEVFSIFMASKPITFFVQHLSFEPPFYYILLHFWMKIFGTSEIAARSLSLTAFAASAILVIFWSEKIFQKHWLSWWTPIFFFANPMLLYYAFEVRTYGVYTFFATLSLWAYTNSRFGWWILATILGFYTHSFFIIVPFAQTLHYFYTHKNRFLQKPKTLIQDPMVRALLVSGLFIAPWTIKLIQESTKLKSSWYYPVDLHLIKSVLGNLFIGYEGTPWYGWQFTRILSLVIFAASVAAISIPKVRKTAGIFFAQIYLPLIAVIGVSFFKPLYVNRYMIPVTIAEVFLVALCIYGIKKPITQKIMATVFLAFVFMVNFWYPEKHAKLDIRQTMTEVNLLATTKDVVMADSTLIIFESMYYSKTPEKVYLYNPQRSPFPWYVGENILSESQMAYDFPPYPMRAFVVHENGTYDIVFQNPK